MLPISNPKQAARPSISRGRPDAERAASATAPGPDGAPRDDDKSPLRPVGLARLKALREAIEKGTYPTEADVLGGLERLLEIDEDDGSDDGSDE